MSPRPILSWLDDFSESGVSVNIELFCAAMLGLLLFGLGFAVSVERGKAKQLGGVPNDDTTLLYRLIRAHGNASEYVPMIAAFALYFAATGTAPMISFVIGGLTAARILHATALIVRADMNRFNMLRFAGGMGTYVGGFALSILAINAAI
jgi:uncharacterized protein